MFGEFVRNRRLELGLSLRAFCAKHDEDPSNWSKMERGVLSPPSDYVRIRQIAKHLAFGEDDPEVQELVDLANAEKGRIPQDIMTEEALVKRLPIVFRTLRGDPPSEEDLYRLADSIRKAWLPDE